MEGRVKTRLPRKIYWSFTLQEDDVLDFDNIRVTSLDGEVKTVTVGSGTNYAIKLWMGPKEEADDTNSWAHHHGMLQSLGGKAIQIGVAKSILCGIYKFKGGKVDRYVKPTENTTNYINYCFKSSTQRKETDHIAAIKRKAQDMAEEHGSISVKKIKAALYNEHGAEWLAKHDKMIDIVLEYDVEATGKYKVPSVLDYNENRAMTGAVLECFEIKIGLALEKMFAKWLIGENGTNSLAYSNQLPIQKMKQWLQIFFGMFPGVSDLTEAAKIVQVIAMLPNVFARSEKMDCLPALYFYGEAGAGKSYLFRGENWKRVATDAGGVGRFKLECGQTGYLLDDISEDFIQQEDNMATLRQLCLGDFADVKVHGRTQRVRGWVAITGQDPPLFLSGKGHGDEHKAAWRRRIISVEMVRCATESAEPPGFWEPCHASATIVFRERLLYRLRQFGEEKCRLWGFASYKDVLESKVESF